MKNNKFTKILAILLSITLPPVFLLTITSIYRNMGWIIPIVSINHVIFIAQLYLSLKSGKEMIWYFLSRRDRLIFVSSLFLMLFFVGLAGKEDMSFVMGVGSGIVGLSLSSCLISFMGSAELKQFWFHGKV
jgi:hypothetical protein